MSDRYDTMSFEELYAEAKRRGCFDTPTEKSKYDSWTTEELVAEAKRRGLL